MCVWPDQIGLCLPRNQPAIPCYTHVEGDIQESAKDLQGKFHCDCESRVMGISIQALMGGDRVLFSMQLQVEPIPRLERVL